jgi:hypothetical protein
MRATAKRTEDGFARAIAKRGTGRFLVVLYVSGFTREMDVVTEYSARWAADKHVADILRYWPDAHVVDRNDVDVVYRAREVQS